VEKDHGRIETPRVWVSDRAEWIDAKSTFPGLKTLVRVEALRETGGKPMVERCCDLSSLPPETKRIGQEIRAYWAIENSRHGVLDRAFDEDRSRVRSGHAAGTLAIRRRFALNFFPRGRGGGAVLGGTRGAMEVSPLGQGRGQYPAREAKIYYDRITQATTL
jgi:hypothetical protein